MRITTNDSTEDNLPIPVTCEVEFEDDGYEVQHIRYGDITYPCLEDLKADFPDCAQELEGLIDVEFEEWYQDRQDRKYYREMDRFED